MTSTPSSPKLPEPLKVVAWGTTRTLDGKEILSEMCVATNPAYVKVHNHHAWDALVKLSDAQASIQALEAEVAGLKKDAARLDWIVRQADEFACGMIVDAPGDGDYYIHGMGSTYGQGKTPRAAIDAARAAQEVKP
jgi:hypothetical protein